MQPSTDLNLIEARLEAIEELLSKPNLLFYPLVRLLPRLADIDAILNGLLQEPLPDPEVFSTNALVSSFQDSVYLRLASDYCIVIISIEIIWWIYNTPQHDDSELPAEMTVDAPEEAKDVTFNLSLLNTPIQRSTLLKIHARLKYLLQIKRILEGVIQLRQILANSELSTILRNLCQVWE